MPVQFDENGLKTQSLAEIKDEIKNGYEYDGEEKKGYVQFFGSGIQLADDTNPGKEITIYAEREQVLQETLQAIYFSQYRATAGGVSLDRNLENIEQQRQAALPSVVIIYAAGTPSTPVDAEELKMKVNGSGEVFLNIEGFTLGSLVDESVDSITRAGNVATATIGGGHSFPEDSFLFIEGVEQPEYNGLKQIFNVAGTTFDFNVTGTPTTPATGTIIAREATGFNAKSENTGAIQALAGAITTISTAVPGIDRVENADDATLGRETETDPEARTRADESLAVLGGSTQKAIKAKMLDVPGVIFSTVFQNVTDFVDANGLPPHSIRVFVDGGADADIWQALYEEAVSAGIFMDGTEQTTIPDDNGESQPVAFSRPFNVRIYVEAGNNLVTNSDSAQGAVFPANGQDQIIANLTAIDFQLGGDVWPAKIKEAINKVEGVISSDPLFDTTTPPTNTSVIVVPSNSRANIDSDDVTF